MHGPVTPSVQLPTLAASTYFSIYRYLGQGIYTYYLLVSIRTEVGIE